MIEPHEHDFEGRRWPFADAEFTEALTTVHVVEGDAPILLVSHDADDGMWQVLCGTTNSAADGRLTCLGCLYEQDPSLGELADLPRGWEAFRESVDAPWIREPSPDADA